MRKKHTLPPEELDLKNALHDVRHLLEHAQVPIITVSATFRKELADKYKTIAHTPSDVIYSRGHYSMAEAVYQQALLMGKSAHMADPTNFVSKEDWKKIEFTQTMGLLVARYRLLKLLRDKVDIILRGKLPIKEAITPPLLYLTESTTNPIISMHYEAGNILANMGKRIVQAVTDPHVHHQYLEVLPGVNEDREVDITYAVFDENTKKQFFSLAESLGKKIEEDKVLVTGPFVDPRIVSFGKTKKTISVGKPINLAITTGGLGTNFSEIKTILTSLAPLLVPPEKIRLFLYAGTHKDFRNFFEDFASSNHIRVGNLDDEEARIRILHDDSIVDANENLIRYMFPWAHGIIAKPSGDMAYDAAVAGCFLLFLSPWGKWEENVREVFIKEKIGFEINAKESYEQFAKLVRTGKLSLAIEASRKLPPIYKNGAKNIINLQSKLLNSKQ